MKSAKKTPRKSEPSPKDSDAEKNLEAIEELPSVEWGERIHTGKTIARQGQDDRDVPGATEQDKQT